MARSSELLRSVPNFGRLFMESGGGPVSYNGRTLLMVDQFPAALGEKLVVTIESTNAKWPQGVGMTEGVEVFGSAEERAVVWEYFSVPRERRAHVRAQLPFSFEVTCRNKRGYISFYNMTEFQGRHEWWSGGSCMIPSEITNGRRYACNDFDLDEDFDDLVFSVVRQSAPDSGVRVKPPRDRGAD